MHTCCLVLSLRSLDWPGGLLRRRPRCMLRHQSTCCLTVALQARPLHSAPHTCVQVARHWRWHRGRRALLLPASRGAAGRVCKLLRLPFSVRAGGHVGAHAGAGGRLQREWAYVQLGSSKGCCALHAAAHACFGCGWLQCKDAGRLLRVTASLTRLRCLLPAPLLVFPAAAAGCCPAGGHSLPNRLPHSRSRARH